VIFDQHQCAAYRTPKQLVRTPPPARNFAANDAALTNVAATRRLLVQASLFAALPATLLSDSAHAIDPTQTQVTLVPRGVRIGNGSRLGMLTE
jgi:hypothetical protein